MNWSSWELELTSPAWLLALLVLVWLGWWFAHSLVDFSRAQRMFSLGLRAVILVLLILALSGLTLLSPTQEQFVICAVDTSLSVGSDATPRVKEFLDRAAQVAGPHRLAVMPFAAEPGLVQSDLTQQSASPALPDRATDLAAAIEAAAGSIPPGYLPRLVLITDGQQTRGDAVRAALQAGLPIDTVPLPARTDPEVQVAKVQAPAQVREGEPFDLEIVIDSNHDDEGLIEIFRGSHKIESIRKPLKSGENRFRVRQSITDERLASYSVRVSDLKSDSLVDNNVESALVYTSGRPRVLMIERDPALSQHLASAMEQEEITVEVRPAAGMPDSLSDLQNYELVILSNIAATDLTGQQMDLLRTYVQDLGGGFLMLGGDQSFGLGGYYKTVIEEILPVRSDFEKEKEKPSLAMVLVIDKSGSMGGEKIEMAKEAAKAAVELLGPSDRVGVIAFEGDFYWVSELQSAGNKGRIIDDISRVEAGGGTVMYPPMEEAYNVLLAAAAKLKHVIVLTDGYSAPGDFEGLAQSMAAAHITCSTVGVVDADENLLQSIAELGQGRYYFTDDPSSVPQIFAKETMTASKSAINEQPFLPQVIRPTQALADIDWNAAPFLLGYVVTRPKPTCEFILAAETGDPLLAWWRYGLGMTAAFTSDAKSRWAAEWLAWPGYSRFWAQLIRQIMRRNEARGVTVQIDREADSARVLIDAIDPAGRFLNMAQTDLTVIDSQLNRQKLSLQQTAPGRYTGQIATPHAGAYHLELTQKQQGTVINQQSRGLTIGYPDELRVRPTNNTLLQSLSEVSGGRFNPAPEKLFETGDRTARRPVELWPWLLSAALILFVFDIALRRLDLSAGGWRRMTWGRAVS